MGTSGCVTIGALLRNSLLGAPPVRTSQFNILTGTHYCLSGSLLIGLSFSCSVFLAFTKSCDFLGAWEQTDRRASGNMICIWDNSSSLIDACKWRSIGLRLLGILSCLPEAVPIANLGQLTSNVMDAPKDDNTKTANQAWRKKPRKFAPKSRLGCKTCK